MSKIAYPGARDKDSCLGAPDHKDLLSQEAPGARKLKKIENKPAINPVEKPQGIQKRDKSPAISSSATLPDKARESRPQDTEAGKRENQRKVFRIKA